MQGASPLASPGAGRDAALGLLVESGIRRGACFLGCLPTLPLAYFAAPLPRRGRISPRPALAERSSPPGKGETKVILCKGLRPLHPRGWVGCGTGVACGKRVTAGGLLFWLPAVPAFSLLCCPHLPDPLPLRGRGRLRLFYARGFAPCIPGAGRGREPAIPAVPIPKAPCGRKIGHRPLGSVNTQYSGKVLGGLGDSFKSPPAFSSAFFPSFPPSPRQMLSDGRGCGSVPAGA